MLLDKLLQNNQMNELSRPADKDMNSRSARKNERDDIRQATFNDILKSVSEKENREEKPREISLQDLRDKIKDIDRKVDKMIENATGPKKAELEEVKKTLDKVKQLLDNLKESGKGAQIDFGKVSIDINLFLNNILSGIQDLLGKTNVKELQNLLSFLNKKIDEANALLNPPNAGEKNAQAGLVQSSDAVDKSFEKTPGKVKIVDLRTKTESETQASGKKGAMMAEKTFGLADQKLVKADKAYEMILSKSMEKEIQEAQKNKDMNPAAFLKNMERDPGALQIKNAAFAGSVSRAATEALFQNVAGRLAITLRDGKSEFKMNLTPPELGHMRMKFTMQDGILMGKVVLSTPEAKQIFDQNLGELQRQLQQAGITMGSMDISFSQDGNFAETEAQKSQAMVGSLFMNNEENSSAEETASYRNDMYGSRINFLA